MKKTKSVEALDRLSELPDALILRIFELLPTRDVVRTTILSRRWKDLWTINPYLCFHAIRGYNNHSFDDIRYYDDDEFRAIVDDNNDIGGDKNNELRRFVNLALSRWRGARVLKFKVSGVLFNDSIFTEMDMWLRFAVDNRVEELDISFKYAFLSVDNGVEYCPPNCLYSCSSLQKLSFDCFTLKIDGSVQWSRLKSLNIVCSSVSRQGIEGVLCGSPLLEEFLLVFYDKDGNLEFRSSSLKKLSIKKGGHTQNKTGLRIWTPNLLELTVSGVSYDCCVLENVTALARANLLFDWGTFLSESSNLTLAAIQRVEGLTLSDSCFEVLEAMRSKSVLSPFLNVKFLRFSYHFNKPQTIVNFLEIFPMLKTLVIDENIGFADPMRKAKFRTNTSKSFLGELMTVEVTWNGYDFLIFPFIKFLLKSARKLEKMVFRVRAGVFSSDNLSNNMFLASTKPNYMFLASKELLEMPRSSPTAKLFFHEY